MKKTVKGKVYDTAEMSVVKKVTSGAFLSVVKKVTSGAFGDPAGYEETLYVAENGSYFLYTYGGEQSPYPAEKLTSLSKVKAQQWEKDHE